MICWARTRHGWGLVAHSPKELWRLSQACELLLLGLVTGPYLPSLSYDSKESDPSILDSSSSISLRHGVKIILRFARLRIQQY